MRIWDLPPRFLCRPHLLGEHRELHGLWSILTNDKQGYRHHRETKRWIGHRNALAVRHTELVLEMERRGYNHRSGLHKFNGEEATPPGPIDSIEDQIARLVDKGCDCDTGGLTHWHRGRL